MMDGTDLLPFNLECLRGEFIPAKRTAPQDAGSPYWLIVQDQGLILLDGNEWLLPEGELPAGFQVAISRSLHLGNWRGRLCWTATLPGEFRLPEGFRRETLVPMQGTRLPDDLLTLGGMAMQALWWYSTSGRCPCCGGETVRIDNEWGKRCRACGYEHYPHLHPAVIVLVRDGDRVLLARKPGWDPNRYSLLAGFVDNGESLEGAVRREVKEEVGVDVDDIRYVGSQNWPFPSQLMVGFVARYAGGEISIDREELEDARWFPGNALPYHPSHHSIASFILEHHARG